MATTVPSASGQHPLQQQLAMLRHRMRFIITLRGIGWLLAVVLFATLTACFLDWIVHLPRLVRAILLVGTLCGAGYVALSQLILPLARRSDDLSIAIQIEERFPSLNDALASTIEFLDQQENPGNDSESLRAEALRRLENRLQAYDFKRVLSPRGMTTAIVSGGTALVAAIVLALIFPQSARTAMLRFTNPFGVGGAYVWPTKTNIQLLDFPTRIGQNEAFEVKGLITGEIPTKVVITYQIENGKPIEKDYPITGTDQPGVGAFASKYDPGYQGSSFKFRVQANDAVTDWHKVEVLPPPRLVDLDGKSSPQIRLIYPAYLNWEPKSLDEGKRAIFAPRGTVVTLWAAADRPLSKAWIEYVPESVDHNQLRGLLPLGLTNPLQAISARALADQVCGKQHARIERDGRSFFVSFQPWLSGNYEIHFQDHTGLTGVESGKLTIQVDRAPTVTIERPNPSTDQLDQVLLQARFPLKVRVEDPRYGSRSVWLEHRLENEMGSRRTPLHDPVISAVQAITAPACLSQFPTFVAPIRPQVLRIVDRYLDVKDLRRHNGTPVEPGDTVVLTVYADDYDNVTLSKQPGYKEITLTIVNKEELENWLDEEQRKIQAALGNLRNEQSQAIEKVREAEEALKQKLALELQEMPREKLEELAEDKLNKKDLDKLKEMDREKLEQMLRDKLEKELRDKLDRAQLHQDNIARQLDNPEDPDSVRNRVKRVLESVKQNQLRRTGVEQRMNRVAKELERITGAELQQTQEQLARLQNQEELKPPPPEKRADRIQQQANRAREQAEQLQQLAEQIPQNEPDRKALEEQIKSLRQQADQLQQMANQLREEAKNQPADAQQRAKQRQQVLERLQQERQQVAQALREAAKQDTQGRDRELNRQADAMQRSADELRQSALAEQRAQTKPELEMLQRLEATQKQQEEVRKTLSDLLQEMEPWSRVRDVQAESRNILTEQRELLQRIEDMKKAGLMGKTDDELTGNEKARLKQVADEQQKLQQRMEDLLRKMERMADERQANDNPRDQAAANDLSKAAEQARNSNLSENMKEAAQSLRKNQLGEAGKQQQAAIEKLEKLTDKLRDRGELELLRKRQDLAEQQAKLEKLQEDVDRLSKEIKEAQKNNDAEKLTRLRQDLKRAQQQAQVMARQLSSQGAGRASQPLEQAAERLEDAVRRLERGQEADPEQEEALERIKEARREVDRKQRETEEELARQQLEKVADTIKGLAKRQESLNERAKTIEKDVKQRNGWDRVNQGPLLRLKNAQNDLAEETKRVAERDLAGAAIFERVLQRSGEAMKRASEQFNKLFDRSKEQPKDIRFDEEAIRAQEEALRRLNQLLEALKPAELAAMARNVPPPEPGPMPDDNGNEEARRPPGDRIPPLAQLKLLRNVQQEIKKRSAAFDQAHPDLDKLTPEEVKELAEIRREQREVAEMLEAFLDSQDG